VGFFRGAIRLTFPRFAAQDAQHQVHRHL
jgi:hypothetical protein